MVSFTARLDAQTDVSPLANAFIAAIFADAFSVRQRIMHSL
jgi:hypothetical protein